MNPRNLLIWNNAVFDNEASEGSASINKCSWSNFQPVLVNLSTDSLQSDCSKENASPVLLKTPNCVKSTQPIKPLHSNSAIGKSLGKPLKLLFKEGLLEPFSEVSKEGIEVQEEIEDVCNKKKIDKEMQEIEEEINRLSSRLESLRLVKAEQSMKAKFMEPKHSIKNSEQKRVASSTKTKIDCRGVSLGPAEIIAGAGLRRIKPEITPIQPIQNRRKSCFWKLQDIDELRATKERRKSLSVSPKLNKTINKVQAATTVGYLSKKPMKKEDGILSSIQPKKLFNDVEKSVPAKKPMKIGRVVASRYNQISSNNSTINDVRKRSLPEDDKDEGKRCDKKRLSGGNVWESCKSQGIERKVKKKWEIPGQLVVYQSFSEVEKSPSSVIVPSKIKTLRCDHETPRDSGPAKRVAELVGRKSYFCDEEPVEGSVCQILSFTEETVES